MENKIEARHLNLYYGQKHALKDVSLDIKENKSTRLLLAASTESSTCSLHSTTSYDMSSYGDG